MPQNPFFQGGSTGGNPQVLGAINAAGDHGALTGLGDDDHTQYALLAGRAGGQVLIGGTTGTNRLGLRPKTTLNTLYVEEDIFAESVALGTDSGAISLQSGHGLVYVIRKTGGSSSTAGLVLQDQDYFTHTGLLEFFTNGTNAGTYLQLSNTGGTILRFTHAGALSIGGSFGTAGQYLRSAGNAASITWSTIPASEVSVSVLNNPTLTTLQDQIDHIGSSGWHDGGVISASGTPGAIDITAGEGFIRATASDDADLLSFAFGPFTAQAIPINTTRYVYINYHATTPTLSLSASEFEEAENKILIGVAVNEGGVITHTANVGVRLGESLGQAGRFLRRVLGISRDARRGGLIIGNTGTRQLTMTAGHLWWGRTDYTINAYTGGESISYHWRNGSGGFGEDTLTSWPNTEYDNNLVGGPTALGVNKYANLWFYMLLDGVLHAQYGRTEHNTAAAAEQEAPPATAPDHISQLGVLLGRIIFKNGVDAPVEVQSAFSTTFNNTGVTDHGDLSGLTDDDHTQYLLASDATSRAAFVTNWTDLTDGGATILHSHAGLTGSGVANTLAYWVDPSTLAANEPLMNHRVLVADASGLPANNNPLTEGRVVFPDSVGELTGSVNLFWDDTKQVLGVGNPGMPSAGTAGIVFADGTALATMAINTAGLFANDVSGTVQMFAIDEAGAVVNLHKPDSANFTGTNWTDLTDGGATTLHSHAGTGAETFHPFFLMGA